MVEDRSKRIHKLKNVVIKDEGQMYPATVSDFSETGMSVRSEQVFPTYKTIELQMKIDGESDAIVLKGSIRWVNEHIKPDKPRFHEMGIGLIDPPKSYLDFIRKID